jgi:hypothetical protein
MANTTTYDLMDREELVRLAGEQALLKQEMSTYNAEQQRDLGMLRNLANDVGHQKDWHERGTQLLDRLRDRQLKIADGYRRMQELSKLTGIN